MLEIINELSQKSQLDQLAGEKYLQAMRRDGQFSESF